MGVFEVKETKGNEFLATAPVGRLLIKLAVPTVAAQIINMLYNIVDRIYLGHMPGDGKLALTGVGVCMPIILIVSAFAALVGSGGAPRASIFMGKGDDDSAQRIMGSCLCATLLTALVLTAAQLIFWRPFLMAFGASEETIGYAGDYIRIYALGTVFVLLTLGMNAYISAQGFTSVSMRTVLIGALCNIALDPIFIFAFKMGVRGAALATIVSQAVSCLWVMRFLTSEKSVIRLKRECLRLDIKVLLPCLALGIAPFIMQGSESLVVVCFNSSLQSYGGDIAVGAMTILSSVMQFAQMPSYGLAQGAQPIMSYNYGAGNLERVKKTFRLLLLWSLCYSLAVWLAVIGLPHVFAGIFTPDAELMAYSASALRIYCAVLFVMGIQAACQMAFVSLGKAGASVLVAVVRKFVLLIPLIYIMPAIMDDKVKAVYMAEPVADFMAVSFTVILFIFSFRKVMKQGEKN